jgi:hypothetical protein
MASFIGNSVLQRCAAIPSLTHLRAWVGAVASRDPHSMLPVRIFSHLQQLHVQIHNANMLHHLAKCNQLRVLQLCVDTLEAIQAGTLCAIVTANAATLEKLCFSCINIERYSGLRASPLAAGAAGEEQWSALASCVRLRVLGLPLTFSVRLTPHLLHALSQAPVFQSLELALPAPPSECAVQWTLLPSALTSASWCTVRLVFPATRCPAALRTVVGLTKMLPLSSVTASRELGLPPSAAALRRLRVIVQRASFRDERCFRLHLSSDGPLEWQGNY